MKRLGALLILVAVVLSALLCACNNTPEAIVITRNGEQVESVTLFEGEEIALAVKDVSSVVWQSNDTAVVVVETDGYVRAKGIGTATVTATKGKASATVTFTVTQYVAVESVTMQAKYTVKAGGFRTLGVSVLPQNASDKSLTYAVSPNDGKITFANGKAYASKDVTPLAQYTITVTNQRSGKEATATMAVMAETQAVAWTIGDSIFDFNDLNDNDMVQTILKNAGYTKWHMDNIAGRTVRAASSVGVIDHINAGMYEAWSEPDLILIQCGTNDCYYMQQQPQFFTKESILSAIEQTCRYLSERYPDARIVWSTPIWRIDTSQDNLQFFIDALHEICGDYGVEVFDLHLTSGFAELSAENFGNTLYDGIHPSAQGKELYISEFDKYLSK